MSGLGIFVILILISAVPAIAVFIWFRIARYPFPPLRFLLYLFAGATAFFPALLLQRILPDGGVWVAGKWNLLFKIFIRGALTEEFSRLLLLFIVFWAESRLAAKTAYRECLSCGEVSRQSAAGLVSGLGFAILESAAYGASDAGVALIRAITAAPLHGACGARVGSAAALFRMRSPQAAFRFFSAAAIHGIYNFMIIIPGFPSIAAVLIALSAFASQVLAIHGGMRISREKTPV